jgi:hypothetical protein
VEKNGDARMLLVLRVVVDESLVLLVDEEQSPAPDDTLLIKSSPTPIVGFLVEEKDDAAYGIKG